MQHWQFKDFRDRWGDTFLRWLDAQLPAVQAEVIWAIKDVSATENLSTNPTFNPLRREHVGIFTLRVSFEDEKMKRHFRPIGFWSLRAGELILVTGCEKSGRVTIPPGAYNHVLDTQLDFYFNGIGTTCDQPF